MKNRKTTILATAAVLLTAVLAGVLAPPAQADVSFDVAYSSLSRHGSWIVSSQYGHVWQPSVYNHDWNPYYDGHWIYTDMGWAWVSDYEWGSIPYHYGTWVSDPDAGWVWIPGSVWAPSWVVFRTDSDYIGWAPVPPGYSVGVSIDMGGPSDFVFVSSRDFLAPRLRGSIIPRDRAIRFNNHTTVVNNIVVQNNVVINRGPDFRTVEKATGHKIREERIERVARVAPFDHVSRSQLAVDPQRMKRGLRVSEPVPADHPLPGADKREARGRKGSPANEQGSQDKRLEARSRAQEPGPPPRAAVTPRRAPVAEKAKPRNTPREVAAPPKSEVSGSAKAEQSAKPPQRAKARVKKQPQEKKDRDSGKGATPKEKEGAK